VAVTCPTAAVSHVMLEAYKKYQLVGLLVHGDKPKDSLLSLPKFTSPIVGKFLKPLCAAYSEVVRAYHVNSPEELRSVVTKYQVKNLDKEENVLPQVSEFEPGIFTII
jgi:COP9 signalosome complex subunit 3